MFFSSFCYFDLGWWRKLDFSVKSSHRPMGPFGDNFGLMPVGMVSLVLLPIGLMSVGMKSLGLLSLGLVCPGLMSLGLLFVGLMSVGLKCVGLKPIGLLPWPWDLEVSHWPS